MNAAQRILLVEDDPDEARRARDALAESGYVVHVAESALRARQAATEEAPFDLVFMDFRLPDGDGLRLLPVLRSAGVRAPVVLLTGDSSERVGEAAFRAGCADLAVKDLNYHLWLPSMAQALIPSAAGLDAWGGHVLGVCVGRVRSATARAQPADLWPPLADALQAATELAVKGVRAAGHSLLGSLPSVHLQLRDRSLLFVLRGGGVYGAALLSRPPDGNDHAELLAVTTAYAQERAPVGSEA
jgi:CheY-like chemotaxis protein